MASSTARESRIDYFFLNPLLAAGFTSYRIDREDLFLTHRPIEITIEVPKVIQRVRVLNKPDDYSILIEDKIDKAIDEDKNKTKDDDTHKHQPEQIRRQHIEDFHKCLDAAIEQRISRIKEAQAQGDTDRQWMLITAAVEQAAIEYLDLQGKDATRMRGRSRVSFRKQDRELTQGGGQPKTPLSNIRSTSLPKPQQHIRHRETDSAISQRG